MFRAKYRYIFSFILIIILLICSWIPIGIAQSPYNNNIKHSRGLDSQNNLNSIAGEISQHHILSRSNPDSQGSWVDSFNDDSKVDYTMTDHMNLSDGEAKQIAKQQPEEFDLDGNTVALWHMNEGTGSTLNDETTNNNDGSISGATWTSGRFGSALDFSYDRVSVSHSSSLDITGQFTIEAWIKAKKSGISYLCIVDKYKGSMTDSYGYTFYLSLGRLKLSIYSGTNGNKDASGNDDLRDDQWHYVAGVYNGTHIVLYVDGKYDSANRWPHAPASTTNALGIGERLSGWGGYLNFLGKIDEVRISNIARTSQEIYEYYLKIYDRFGNVTSKPIDLPNNMYWDSLIINRVMPKDNELEITILDATDAKRIPGSPIYNESRDFDISYIDPALYPSIKLNASLKSNLLDTSIIKYWGVSWNASYTWCDTFFYRRKVESRNDVVVIDGSAEIENTGYLNSTTINAPKEHYYNKLIINKTQPSGTTLNTTVLDAKTNSKITGFIDMVGTTIDISSIDPLKYPAIKLRATVSPSSIDPGNLHDWSLNFSKNTQPKIDNISISKNYVNRTESVNFRIDLVDHEEGANKLTLLVEYKHIYDFIWETEYLNEPYYENGLWKCSFSPPAESKLGAYSFRFVCNDAFNYIDSIIKQNYIVVLNNLPVFSNISISGTIVNRTETVEIKINAIDIEVPAAELGIKVKYKSTQSPIWKSISSQDIIYNYNYWLTDFTPGKVTDLGWYIFNVTCNDTETEIYKVLNLFVQNNKPTQPEVTILPVKPNTLDDLNVNVLKTKDVESPSNQIKYWYKWFKDNFHISTFDNLTSIPHSATLKNERWRCQVYPFDGVDLGVVGEAEVIIQNSPPKIIKQFNKIEMFEDSEIILHEELIKVFNDSDFDKLTFYTSGQKNIDIEILQTNGTIIITPDKDWFGVEYIIFYAVDTSSAIANVKVELIVNPINDLPKITRVGDYISFGYSNEDMQFIIKQNEWLILPIMIEDTDDDVERGTIKCILNITERNNLYLQDQPIKLIFHPTNDDVGLHFINIKVTDNSETPPRYITQSIRIQVLNVNDPPTVKIIEPMNGSELFVSDAINFTCIVDDVDFLVKDYPEKLSFHWSTDNTKFSNLGNTPELNNISLSVGEYTITIEVEDLAGKKAYDYIQITIKDAPKDIGASKEQSTPDDYLWLVFLLIIFLLLCIISFILIQKRKSYSEEQLATLGVTEGELLKPKPRLLLEVGPAFGAQPIIQGVGITQGATTQLQQAQPQVIQREPIIASATTTIGTSTTERAQLPPAGGVTQQAVLGQSGGEEQYGIDPNLPIDQKLELLEELLLLDQISEPIYLQLKAALEQDGMQQSSAQPQTTPRLPPAIGTTPEYISPKTQLQDQQIQQPQQTQPQQKN